MLHDQFGLDLEQLRWVTFEPAHVDGFVDPPNARRAPDGQDAGRACCATARSTPPRASSSADYPDLRTLIPDAVQVEADWIRQTGIRPINHTLVVRADVAAEQPVARRRAVRAGPARPSALGR